MLVDDDASAHEWKKAGDRAHERRLPGVRRSEHGEELAVPDVERYLTQMRGRTLARAQRIQPDVGERTTHGCAVRSPRQASGTQAAPTAPRQTDRVNGDVHASSGVAATGPMKGTPTRGELMRPIAPPPARCEVPAP